MNKPLSCNGCTACCEGDAIRKLPLDSDDLAWVPHFADPSQMMLDHKPNGDCIYLIKNGCGIHERKPHQCREMDCRRVASHIKTKAQAIKINMNLKAWKRGKELIKRDRYKL